MLGNDLRSQSRKCEDDVLGKVVKWIKKFFYNVLAVSFVALLAFVSVSVYLFVVLTDFVFFMWDKITGGRSDDR